jgi:alkanesulfonate monooxygenase SsuD/methylene tetrahydromethanopterin reductase-like flavin-dependent oxidoreductase (luciferase family)
VHFALQLLFARRMSTFDPLTGGRVGWNIVTGYLDSAARGMGIDAPARTTGAKVGRLRSNFRTADIVSTRVFD